MSDDLVYIREIILEKPDIISDTLRSLPVCFQNALEIRYGKKGSADGDIYHPYLKGFAESGDLFETGCCRMADTLSYERKLLFVAIWKNAAIIGYQPTWGYAPTPPKFILLRDENGPNVYLEEFDMTYKERQSLLRIIRHDESYAVDEVEKAAIFILCSIPIVVTRQNYKPVKATQLYNVFADLKKGKFDRDNLEKSKKKVSSMEIIITSAVISTVFTTIFLLAYFL